MSNNPKTINSSEVLQYALESGMIDMDSVLEEMMMNISKKHPYTITPPKKAGDRWQTNYVGKDGKRRNIKANTREELLKKLQRIYSDTSHIDNLTFHGLYEEWLDYKSTVTNSPNTIKRHRNHYKKYFEPSILHLKKVKQLDELMLEKECNRIVKAFNLSRKEWCNVKTILNGMYEYALRKHYLSENPMEKVQILIKFRQIVRKTGKTETFNTEESQSLNRFLMERFEESGDTSYIAVAVNLLLGLRCGELVSLKWTDLIDEKHLHIVREEVRDQTTNIYTVVEHTKTNRDRFVIVVPKALELFRKIEPQGDYIFMRDGERITSIRIASVLRKYARYMGVPLKSSHKLRKTYASTLNANGVPLDCIREMLGHSNLNTTLGYIYNPLTEQETYDLITGAL